MSSDEVTRIIVAERDELAAAGNEYRALGKSGRAEQLERRVQIVEAYLA